MSRLRSPARGCLSAYLRLAEWRFQPDALALSLIALWSIFACSIAMAAFYSGIAIAAGSLARVLLFGISIYVFLYVRDGPGRLTMRASQRGIRWLFWAGALSALYACVDFYFQFSPPAGYEQQFVWLESGVYRRAQGFFYEASTLGNLCAFFLGDGRGGAAAAKGRAERGPAGVPARALRGSRAAGGCAGSVVFASVFGKPGRSVAGSRLAASRPYSLASNGWLGSRSLEWAAVSLYGARSRYSRGPRGCEYRLHSSISRNRRMRCSPAASMPGRTLGGYLMANPWRALLGVGYKTLPYSDFIGTKAVGDNTYLTLLAETGIAGLLAVVAVNVAILTCAYRAARSSDSVRSFTGAWMFCFWAGQSVQMLSADLLTYWRVLPVYFFVLALAARNRA